jgi:hypothetical protein
LDIPERSAADAVAHVSHPWLKTHSFQSDNYAIKGTLSLFKIDGVAIFNRIRKEILKGDIYLNTGLWRINLRKEIPHNPISAANNVYELCNTIELVNYLHKEMFSPTKAAPIKALKQGHLVPWSGLTEDAINNHLKLTPAMEMGHMDHKR